MNLTADEREAIEGMKAEAHLLATRPDGSIASGAAPTYFVGLLQSAEGIHPEALGDYLEDLSIKGAAKVLSDWRRGQREPARTAKGTEVDAPHYAGVKRPGGDGAPEYVQVSLPGMSLDELRSHKEKLEAQRNTLSREVRLVADLIAVMEAEDFTTAGQALDHLLRAA